jgi:preprotein translocase subunit YajC
VLSFATSLLVLGALLPGYGQPAPCLAGWPIASWLLAQDAAPNPLGSFFPAMVAIMLLAYFMFMRPQQQKLRQYEQMIENLKENDHVITSGGIYGVVTSVQRDAKRVTLRIDDATGAKIKVGLWAIAEIQGDDKEKPSGGASDRSPRADSKKTDVKNKK